MAFAVAFTLRYRSIGTRMAAEAYWLPTSDVGKSLLNGKHLKIGAIDVIVYTNKLYRIMT